MKTSISYPNLLQALGLTVIVMSSLYLFSLTLPFLQLYFGQAALLIYYVAAMSTALWIILTISQNGGDRKQFYYKASSPKIILLLILATLSLLFGIIYPISFLIPISETTKIIFKASLGTTDVFTFLAIVIAAPILEEHIFRGILLDGLLKNYSPVLAILISSLLFGIFHVNPLQISSAFIGGLFLGWIFYKTENTLYGMLIHFIVNLTGFLLLSTYKIDQLLDMSFQDAYGNMMQASLVISLAILSFSVCIYFLSKKINCSCSVLKKDA